jgi:hypothetical protein
VWHTLQHLHHPPGFTSLFGPSHPSTALHWIEAQASGRQTKHLATFKNDEKNMKEMKSLPYILQQYRQ